MQECSLFQMSNLLRRLRSSGYGKQASLSHLAYTPTPFICRHSMGQRTASSLLRLYQRRSRIPFMCGVSLRDTASLPGCRAYTKHSARSWRLSYTGQMYRRFRRRSSINTSELAAIFVLIAVFVYYICYLPLSQYASQVRAQITSF